MEKNRETESSKPVKERPPKLTLKQEVYLKSVQEYLRDMPSGRPRSGPGMEFREEFWRRVPELLNNLEPNITPRSTSQWQRAMAYWKHRVSTKAKKDVPMTAFEKRLAEIYKSYGVKCFDVDQNPRSEFEEDNQQSGANSPSESDEDIEIYEAEVSLEETETIDPANVSAQPRHQFQAFQNTPHIENTPRPEQMHQGQMSQIAGAISQHQKQPSPQSKSTNQEKITPKTILNRSRSQDHPITELRHAQTNANRKVTFSKAQPAKIDQKRFSNQHERPAQVQNQQDCRPISKLGNSQDDVNRSQKVTFSQAKPENSGQKRSLNETPTQVQNISYSDHSEQTYPNNQNSAEARNTLDTSHGTMDQNIEVTPPTPRNTVDPRIREDSRESNTANREDNTSTYQAASCSQNKLPTPKSNRKKTKEDIYMKISEMTKLLSSVVEQDQRRSCEQAEALTTLADGFATIADAAIRETESRNLITRSLKSIAESLEQLVQENRSKRPKMQ